jgi:hypothetical protein
MKLLKRSFLLLLVAYEVLKYAKGKNEKLKENKQGGKQQNSSTDSCHPPTNAEQKSTSPVEISIVNPNPQDEQNWRNEQKEFWKRQLAINQRLNCITLFAGLVGLAGLVVLYFTLITTQESVETTKTQFERVKDLGSPLALIS